MRLAATLAAIGLLAAGPAQADDLLQRAAACSAAADHPLCLLKVSAERDGGSSVWRDDELRRTPAITSALGLTAKSVAAARGADPTERMFFGAMDEASMAVDEVLALDRAGRPAAESLRPVLDLSTRSPDLPLFFAARGQPPPARAEAFQALLRRLQPAASRPSPVLARFAAEALERELSAPGVPPEARRGAFVLALAYQDQGNEAGVERAMALLPYGYDRLNLLIELRRLDEAAKEIGALKRSDIANQARAELRVEAARLGRLNAATAAGMPDALEQEAREARVRGDEELARLVEQSAKAARAAPPPPPPRIQASDVEAKTDEILRDLEQGLVTAALAAGRPEAARPIADRMFARPGAHEDRRMFEKLLKVATPAVAADKLDSMERAMTPQRGALRLAAVVEGWRTLGRPERAVALEARAKAWVAANPKSGYAQALGRLYLDQGRTAEASAVAAFEPRELLESDVKAGIGLRNLDAYLAQAKDESARIQLLVACPYALEAAGLFAEIPRCMAAHQRVLTQPVQRYAASGRAIQSATLAAHAGDAVTARALFDQAIRAGTAAVEADPKTADYPPALNPTVLVTVAKAELRADGRLPRSASPPQP